MDWSKSKSIFIVVFLILDVFLYSLYLNLHTEAQQVEVLGNSNIEARLKEDNITYGALPNNIEKAAYISAKVKNFDEVKLPFQNAQDITIENNNKLIVILKDPIKLKSVEDKVLLNEFVKANVTNGADYTLWDIDPENQRATFFQRVNDRTIYYNINGVITVYWNEDNEITMYEQTLLEDIEAYEEEETLLMPIQAIQTLYAKGLLKPDSSITEIKLGYSTLVQLTQTQVFVPTWEVRVKTSENVEEEYFVNAVEGKIIDVQLDTTKVEEVEETSEDDIPTNNKELKIDTDIEKE